MSPNNMNDTSGTFDMSFKDVYLVGSVETINNTPPDEDGNFNINEYDISVKDGRLCINKIGGDK